ncbi:ATP-binding protein [Streptomyces sp. NPDC048281]|uniref:ATP-binding protein n=1 Tax=Streptomyces sp. NPDC048281 TaxID=3154715 RepID=UPI0034363D67
MTTGRIQTYGPGRIGEYADTACRNLRLPTMRGQFSEPADAAARDQMTYRGFLAELLMAECEWVRKGLPLCLIDDSGTGKSHLLIALGAEGAMAGFRVKYVLTTKLVNELVEAADEKVLTKTIARYGPVDLLCIDELGYMELDRRGAELLFQVLTGREEKNSMAIASNESFSSWTETFTDPRLCAAIVDRLTFGGDIIETGSDSYRLAHTKARQQATTAS